MAEAFSEPSEHAGDGASRNFPDSRCLRLARQHAGRGEKALSPGHRRTLCRRRAAKALQQSAEMPRNEPQSENSTSREVLKSQDVAECCESLQLALAPRAQPSSKRLSLCREWRNAFEDRQVTDFESDSVTLRSNATGYETMSGGLTEKSRAVNWAALFLVSKKTTCELTVARENGRLLSSVSVCKNEIISMPIHQRVASHLPCGTFTRNCSLERCSFGARQRVRRPTAAMRLTARPREMGLILWR